MYAKYLQYSKKTKCIETAQKVVNYYNTYSFNNYSVKNVLLSMFVDKNANHDSWDPSTCILRDFPFEMQVDMINNYISKSEDNEQPSIDCYEVCKLVYNLWNCKESDKKLNDCCNNIIIPRLDRFLTHTADELQDIPREYCSGSAWYYGYYILGFIPLLKNEGLDVIDIVYKMRYDDGQDLLTFGLYQYEPSKFYNKLKEILIYWYNNKNISYCGGTGILRQLKRIVNKYKDLGYDLLEDPDLPFLKKYLENVSVNHDRDPLYSWINSITQGDFLDPNKFV